MLENVIINLWHISRTALAGMPTVPTRWDRMIYIKSELIKNNPDLIIGLSNKKLWLFIEEAINHTKEL